MRLAADVLAGGQPHHRELRVLGREELRSKRRVVEGRPARCRQPKPSIGVSSIADRALRTSASRDVRELVGVQDRPYRDDDALGDLEARDLGRAPVGVIEDDAWARSPIASLHQLCSARLPAPADEGLGHALGADERHRDGRGLPAARRRRRSRPWRAAGRASPPRVTFLPHRRPGSAPRSRPRSSRETSNLCLPSCM